MTTTALTRKADCFEEPNPIYADSSPKRISKNNLLNKEVSTLDPSTQTVWTINPLYTPPKVASPWKTAAIVTGKIALYTVVSLGTVASSYFLFTHVAPIGVALSAVSRIKGFSLVAGVSGWSVGMMYNLAFPIIYSADMRGKPFDLFRMTKSNFKDCNFYLLQTAAALVGGAAISATLPLSMPLLTCVYVKWACDQLKTS